MRELSLFSGAGGGLLGSRLLGWRHIGYVEINTFCQKVLDQRIKDGFLEKAPIFTDVCEFLQSGAARQYRGFTDVVTAGFPCQPFSVAGKQQTDNDDRNMWPATIGIIRTVNPRFCLLENVPGLLSAGEQTQCLDDGSTGSFRYVYTIFRDLAEAGYDARWCVLGADDCGAPHHRKRLWIYAYTQHDGSSAVSERGLDAENVPDAEEGSHSSEQPAGMGTSDNVADAEGERIQRCGSSGEQESHTHVRSRLSLREGERFNNAQWEAEPRLDRVVDGMANRVDRIKALGNGQVPIVAATAWHRLNGWGDFGGTMV